MDRYPRISDHHGKNFIRVYFSHPIFPLHVRRVYWRGNADAMFHVFDTDVTTYTLENLSPNSQYIIYVLAFTSSKQSLPSETLVAWTDPAFPAFVEVRETEKPLEEA